MGGKDLNFYVGTQSPFTNKNASEEEKMLGKARSCREMFEGTCPRWLSSLDLTNGSQVNFGLTWVTFQEVPAKKIDFRCARKG